MTEQMQVEFVSMSRAEADAARRAALVRGDRIYNGHPCKKCGCAERQAKTGKCLECYRKYQRRYQPEWKASNREKANGYRRDYYHRDYSRQNAQRIAWRIANPAGALWQSARVRAKKIGIEFTISVEDIFVPTHCPVLGVLLKRNTGGRSAGPYSPTLDRHDNTRGYVPGNVCVISRRANMMKADATVDEIAGLLKYMREPPSRV